MVTTATHESLERERERGEREPYMKGKYSVSLIMYCPTSNFLFHTICPAEMTAIATGHRHTWLYKSEISLCIFMKLNGYALTNNMLERLRDTFMRNILRFL